MRVEVTTAAGASLRFEGEEEELGAFVAFVEHDAPRLLQALIGVAGRAEPGQSQSGSAKSSVADGKVGDLQARLEAVDAATDIDRLTVMAQFALDTGLEGLTAETAESWYTQLGIPKPGRLTSTFGNVKARGYIHHTPSGWRPTTAGENYARHGIRRQQSRRRSS